MDVSRKTTTKPLAIIKNKQISVTTKSSSTSSPLSSSSSSTASSSSATSPPTTIQTLIVRPSNARLLSSSSSTTPPPMPPPGPPQSKSSAAIHAAVGGRQQQQQQSSSGGAAAKQTTGHHHHHNNNVHIPSDILDDLASRFIINVPDDERNNLIRICFQIELAQWFYLDFFCAIDDKKLMPCGMKQFAIALFKHIPFLKVHLPNIDKILEDWKQYKLTVPTYGAILMSEELRHVLLVQSFWAKSSWGFPKGKVNEHEDPIHCATREVFEETGYDITGLIVQTDYIEAVINYQYTRLYLVRNVPFKTQFIPRTRKEIKCCEWFPIDSLPTNKNDGITKQNLGINANSFFMIIPFIKRLKKWVNDHRNSTHASGDNLGAYPKSIKQQPNNNSIYNYNNSLFSVMKKLDTKLSFKTGGDIAGSGLSSLNTSQQTFAATNAKLSNKRQRHKSMGDLDGSVNSNLNKQQQQQRNQQYQLPTSDFFSADHQQQQQQSKRSNQYKRQFSNTSSTNLNLSAAMIAPVSAIGQHQQSAPSYPFDLIPAAAPPPIMKSSANGDLIKSDFFINANSKQPPPSKLLKGMKKSRRNLPGGCSAAAAANTAAVNFNHALAKSQNFNSWTNFSFSKNYITDVFC